MHIAIRTITAMSRPVCGRFEPLDEEEDAELGEVEPLPEPLDVPPLELLPPPLLVLAASTVTVPCIDGWIEQM